MEIAGLDLDGLLKSIAAKLAHQDADIQSEFFNIFFNELKHACETHFRTESQCLYIADKLSDVSQEYLPALIKSDD